MVCIFNNADAQVSNISSKADAFHNILPIEKLYLTFDKPYYSVGDTLWFKSFLLDGNLKANTRSDKIYVELFSDSLKFIENRVIALNNGLGYGDFALTNKLKEGTYVIRAYSNWQQNFGSDYFFQKSFYLGNAGEKTWLLDAHQKLNTGKKTLDLKVRITNLKNEAAGLKDVEIVLMKDKKRVMKADLQTSLQGIIETHIPLGDNKINEDYNFIITDKKDRSRQVLLPINLQEVDQIDLQFMPEGGHMVNGIFGRVAFKAIGADGLGKNISGKIVNSKNEIQAELKVTQKGIGSFYLLPTKGEIYTAIYSLKGKEQKQILPTAKEEGTTIRIDQLSKSDSLYVYVKVSESKRLDNYQLLAQAAGETVLTVNLNLKNGFSTLKLPKQDFPDGIIHFTLFSPEGTPLNERQVFINRKQKINLTIAADKDSYKIRDSVSLELAATKEDDSPLSGSFAIAVTDNGQVKQPTDDENIASYFLLQSDLKGNVENPSWYFKNENPSTLLALDHLLLTQGWVGYNWDEILKKTPQIKFKAEKGNTIEGRLTGLFKNPVSNIKLTLLSLGKDIFLTDTISNKEGRFSFKNLPLSDSAAYTIKIKNAKGRTSSATIAVDELIPAQELTAINLITPWYVNSNSAVLAHFLNGLKKNEQSDRTKLILSGTALKEVEIKGQSPKIMYEIAWDAEFKAEITEEELKKNSQKSLLDLLRERFPSFGIRRHWFPDCAARLFLHKFDQFTMGSHLISLIKVDNISTYSASGGGAKAWLETNKLVFNVLKATDIKNIKLYKGCAFYYLSITTRSGAGPWVSTTPGVYVYRPLPIHIGKDFYSPKYNVEQSTTTPDYRSTIFWDANVVTDENGKAKISFYAADKPTTYTIKVEGTDLYGRFGFQKSTITVVSKSASK